MMHKAKITLGIGMILILVAATVLSTNAMELSDKEVEIKLNEFLDEALDAGNITDAAVMVVDKNQLIYSYKYGEVKTLDEKFVIGSTSKSFTSLAIMQLMEENKINLDDKISKYIGADILDENLGSQIAIRDLLNHTSGIRGDVLKDIDHLEQYGQFFYNNNNYSLLGLIIETVTGLSYDQYMKEHIFDPLDMANTSAGFYNNKDESFMPGHKVYFGIPLETPFSWSKEHIPAGYIVSTPNDMTHYLEMYLNDGKYQENKLLSEAFIKSMYSAGPSIEPEGNQTSSNYGMGLFFGERSGEPSYWHPGTVESYSTKMAILPEREIAYIVLFSVNDIVTAKSLYTQIDDGIFSILIGESYEPLNENAYWFKHGIVDVLLLILLLLAALPLVWINKWKQHLKLGVKFWNVIFMIIIHFVIPITFMVLLNQFQSFYMLFGFLTDAFLVWLLSMLILVATGVYKVVYIYRKKVENYEPKGL
ncbi:MAG: beta-lactamase family protein [Clostridia bacterium]|nr:beta-lactamase family protein [Clostridia bacterium]